VICVEQYPHCFFRRPDVRCSFYAATRCRKDKQNHYTLKGKSVLVALIVFFLCFGWLVFVTFPTAEVQDLISSQQWSLFTIVWIVVLGACFQYTRWVKQAADNGDLANETTRANYWDAIKTLIAAAGVAIAIILTGTGKLASDE
jgi:Mn2+/Fe2+ NRAMP family transporter